MGWWVEYKMTRCGATPFTPGREPVESAEKPEGLFWGPFHCKKCAELCANFGFSEERAWLGNHGTLDERVWN